LSVKPGAYVVGGTIKEDHGLVTSISGYLVIGIVDCRSGFPKLSQDTVPAEFSSNPD